MPSPMICRTPCMLHCRHLSCCLMLSCCQLPAAVNAKPRPPGLYPASADDYEGLAAAIERLGLNDASVTVKKETSDALGAGFR